MCRVHAGKIIGISQKNHKIIPYCLWHGVDNQSYIAQLHGFYTATEKRPMGAKHRITVSVMRASPCCPAQSSHCPPWTQDDLNTNWNGIWPWVMINLGSPRSFGQSQDFQEMRYLLEAREKNSFLAKIEFTEFLPVLCFQWVRQRGVVGKKSSSLPGLKWAKFFWEFQGEEKTSTAGK